MDEATLKKMIEICKANPEHETHLKGFALIALCEGLLDLQQQIEWLRERNEE